MKTKRFHVGDVLSVVSVRLLSTKGIDGVYDILNFMSNDKIFTTQIPRVIDECKPHLLRQFPWLASKEMEIALEQVSQDLMLGDTAEDCFEIIKSWYGKLLTGKFGIEVKEYLEVEELPPHTHEFIDMHSELAEKMHPSRIIPVTVA